MKKVLGLLLAAVLLMSSLSFATAEEYTHLDWFMPCSALPSEWNLDEPIFKAITDATGVTCSMQIPAEDPDTKLNLLMIDGKLPDLITTYNTDMVSELVNSGLVWDLEELFATYLPDAQLPKHIPDDLMANYKDFTNGGWYATTSSITAQSVDDLFPYVTQEIADYYNACKYDYRNAVYFYGPYMEKLGITPIDINTEAELLDVFDKIAAANLTNEDGASVYPVMVGGNVARRNCEAVMGATFGAMPVSDDGHYQNINYSDEYKDAMKFFNKLAQKGYITESELVIDERTLVGICNSGRAACFIGNLYTLNSSPEVERLWVSAGSVVSDRGSTPVLPYSQAIGRGWLYTMVSKKTPYPEACAKFLDYMTSREGMMLHMYGIEGVDYYLDEDGALHRTPEGEAKVEDGVSGLWGFWAFQLWQLDRAVKWIDTSFIKPWYIYGSCDNVQVYDSSLFDLPAGYIPADSDLAYIKTEVDNYLDTAVPEIFLAKDDAEFEALYADFIKQLDALGLREYDAYVDELVQKRCQERGITLAPIN